MNATDQAVAEYLTAANIDYTAALMGETTREGWLCDEWRVTFTKRAQSGAMVGEPLETRFYTGTGHRKSVTKMPDDIARLGARIIARVEWEKRHIKPVTPTAASVLCSLLADASADGESFSDWCGNYGYDTDSRKALAMYLECQETAAKLAQLFNREQRAELHTMLEDY